MKESSRSPIFSLIKGVLAVGTSSVRGGWSHLGKKDRARGLRHVNGAAEQLHVSHVSGGRRKSLIHRTKSLKSEAFGVPDEDAAWFDSQLFVTIEDVAHEEDLRRIRPLKVVVPCHGAVNWSSHHGSDREHAPAANGTLCISVELKRPVFHTSTNWAEAKRERLLGKSQRNIKCHKTRTAEVTICIISERLPDRPRQLPHASV